MFEKDTDYVVLDGHEIAYAAKDDRSKLPNVPINVINTVLNMYLENGTQESLSNVNKSWKFLKVG